MSIKPDSVVAYLDGLQTVKSYIYHFGHSVLQGHMTNENYFISTIKVPTATKLSRMLAYLERLLRIKLTISLVTWSCKIT